MGSVRESFNAESHRRVQRLRPLEDTLNAIPDRRTSLPCAAVGILWHVRVSQALARRQTHPHTDNNGLLRTCHQHTSAV
jgi:hypothetical protein